MISEWPVGDSRMHAAIRAHDWAATPLGPIDEWPQSLKTAVAIMLGAGFPTLLLWGPNLLQFYNDPYMVLNKGQMIALGAPHHQSWPEMAGHDAPIFERVWRNEAVMIEDARYSDLMHRLPDDASFTISYSPVQDELARVAGAWVTLIETTERTRAEATLRENEARLAEVLELVPVGVSLYDRDGNMIKVNPEMLRLFGLSRPLPIGEMLQEVFDSEGLKIKRHDFPASRALRGETVKPEVELVIEVQGAKRWLRLGAVPRFRDGRIDGGISIAYDVTEAKESADRMKVLVAELQHRTRNVIAVVRALTDKTLQRSATLEEFSANFRIRLAALARVQGLLSRVPKGGRVTFDTLLRAELAAHAVLDGDARVILDGPAGVRLRSGSVQILALALHELATNASKYGALVQPGGRLSVRWRVEPADTEYRRRLLLEWHESGVEMPPAAGRSIGYGRELIERVLPYQLKASTSYELGPDGVRCAIALLIAGDAAA